MKIKNHLGVIVTGLVVGAAAVLLVAFGNPANMGFCIACFLRDTAGALGMHSAGVVQYVRPEIIGLLLGALIMSLCTKEFAARGGSAPALRFVIGFVVMVGALMFLGCPLRMVLRLAGGDLNAILGLVGFIGGVFAGTCVLRAGFSLKRSYLQSKLEGLAMPLISVLLLVVLIAIPSILLFSAEGPGSMRAPVLLSLVVGLVVGALAQRSRLCMAGGVRDIIMFRDFHLFYGFLAILVAAFIGNLCMGWVNFSFADQPIAHVDGLWNFLGMALVGVGSVMLGGCPLRQLILAGSGNSDSAITVFGMLVGAALCHNFGLASSAAGPTGAGKIAVIIGFIVLIAIILCNLNRNKKQKEATA